MTEPLPMDENEFAKRLEQVELAARNDPTSNPEGPDADNPVNQDQFDAAARVIGLIHRVRKSHDTLTHETITDQLETPGEIDFGDFTSRENTPKKIGRFQIKRQLGQGGYGLVFLAYDPQLDRDVAIKVPRPETIMTAVLASRFMREAKAAASLSHPNIVPVFEAGSAGPICFIAYELVEGITLAQWLAQLTDTELLDPRDSSRLVATLADAVQHAHQRGILHRDLKPANVMLTEKKDPGLDSSKLKTASDVENGKTVSLNSLIPMITDFGLAKIVASEEISFQSAGQTRTGTLLGTPAYMPPEQVKSEKELIGPTSDVYSLGVLFYELLTNYNPFTRDSLMKTMEAVQTVDPTAPSRLNPQVSRDLDAIVLKCLEKNTANRYSTAADLRTDLERYLNREPVQARKITAVTRSARWISRNRFVAALLGLLLIGTVCLTIALVRARQAEADARVAETAAVVETKTAVTVSDFLKDIFQVPDLLGGKPGQQRGREITAEDILQHGAVKIRKELDDQPKVKARLMTTIGSILVKLGSYEEGESLLRDALSRQTELLESDDPERAISHRELAKVLRLRERIDEAEAELRAAIRILEADVETNRQELSVTFNDLGLVLRTRDLEAARDAYQRARDLRAGDNADGLWRLDVNIAAIDARLGHYASARDAFERALKGARQAYGSEDHPSIGTILNNLAFVQRKLGNYRLARELQEENLRLSEETLGVEHPQVGMSLIGLTAICQRLGDYDAAASYGLRAIEINSKNLPAEHRHITISMTHHAETLFRIGDYDNARAQMEEAELQTDLRKDPDAARQRIRNRLLMAMIERLSGNPKLSLEIMDQVLADPVLDDDLNIGMNARFARALALAQLNDERAENNFHDALRFAEKLPNLLPQDRAYFEARFWALSGNTKNALTQLEQAVDAGYRDALLLTDPDLVSVRDEPRYEALAEEVDYALRGNNR